MLEITQRNLPHWKIDGAIYWITFRLFDSLPQGKLTLWRQQREEWVKSQALPWNEAIWMEYDRLFGDRIQQWLDSGLGECVLARPLVRMEVQHAILKFNSKKLTIHGAVIMPNHVHLLLEPFPGEDISLIMKGIKGASARGANKVLGKKGSLWMEESFDHIVRSEAQYFKLIEYIKNNPVKARLEPQDYWLFQPS
jgi:REP element-mobilizing transposase RayT